MARTVHLACARCGHPEMVIVASAENDEGAVAEIARFSADKATAAALRLERLKHLPTSLPVGGIITPV